MNTENSFQFTTSTLFGATSYVAFVLVLTPLACDVTVEIVILAALGLCLLASVVDQLPPLKITYLRTSLSVLLAIAMAGLFIQVLRGKASFNPATLLALTISVAFLRRASMAIGKYRIACSAMGCALLIMIVAFRYYHTSGQGYFVNRFINHSYDSATFEKDGVVSYTLSSHLRQIRRRSPMEVETLFDALDIESCYRQ